LLRQYLTTARTLSITVLRGDRVEFQWHCFPRIAWHAYRRRRQEYLGLLANHVIALQWTLHPPCGRLQGAAVVAKHVA
jgi:hypothetical protein